MSEKKTLVVGASQNPARYAYKAIHKLRYFNHPVVALGKKEGLVDNVKIETGNPLFTNIDTISIYLNKENQKPIENYLLSLNPKRIIFNPGAENNGLKAIAEKKGIETMEACTLVMLTIGAF